MRRMRSVSLRALLALAALLAVVAVMVVPAAARHLATKNGYYYGLGDDAENGHVHSFTEDEDKNYRRSELGGQIMRSSGSNQSGAVDGPDYACERCLHAHLGYDTKYAECHYFSSHYAVKANGTQSLDQSAWHHRYCGPR